VDSPAPLSIVRVEELTPAEFWRALVERPFEGVNLMAPELATAGDGVARWVFDLRIELERRCEPAHVMSQPKSAM
jgi:hypothetical protein